MTILENLWYGNIHPAERSIIRGSDYAPALARVQEKKEKLFEGLPPEAEAFTLGFGMGVQMLLEAVK